MEPFRLDRQAKVFLAVLVVLALALIPLAPFAALAFGALSLVVLCIVWLIALARNRRLFGPLTQTEGALALAAGTFAVGGALVVVYSILMLGAGNAMMLSHAMLPFSFTEKGPRAIGESSRHYGDASTQQRFKEALAKAGVPFETRTREGKEFVAWSQAHNEAVEAIHKQVLDGPFPDGRNARFDDHALQKEFADWLTARGVKNEIVKRHGEDWVVWEGQENLAHEFMTTRPTRPCKDDKKTAQAPGSAKCS